MTGQLAAQAKQLANELILPPFTQTSRALLFSPSPLIFIKRVGNLYLLSFCPSREQGEISHQLQNILLGAGLTDGEPDGQTALL